MIRFAVKILIVMVAAGYAVRQAEPPAVNDRQPQVIHAAYMTGADEYSPALVASELSSFTNVQIVVAQASRDVAGFCERQPLACEAGRELLRRTAAGVRDISARIAGDGNAGNDEISSSRYTPSGDPAIPAAPPPRYVTF